MVFSGLQLSRNSKSPEFLQQKHQWITQHTTILRWVLEPDGLSLPHRDVI